MRDFDWKILSTLYRTRNITQTAQLLFTTQPALTRRIQQMEKELETTLVLRTNKGVSFTPEGVQAALKAADILKIIDNLKSSISESNGQLKGVLRLGAPNSYVHFMIPVLLEKFSIKYPGVHVEIHTDLSHTLLRYLEEKELDVSFVRGDISTSLNKQLLSKDQISIISKYPIDLSRLPSLPQIAYPKEHSILQATEEWWKERYKAPPLIRFRVHSGDACLQMVKHGLGYGIFSDIHYFDPNDHLSFSPLTYLDGTKFTRKSWLVYDKADLRVNPPAAHFIEFVNSVRNEVWSPETYFSNTTLPAL